MHQGQRPLAARTGRTQTRNRHDSPKPKTPLTRGGRPHSFPPAASQIATLLWKCHLAKAGKAYRQDKWPRKQGASIFTDL